MLQLQFVWYRTHLSTYLSTCCMIHGTARVSLVSLKPNGEGKARLQVYAVHVHVQCMDM